MWLHVVTRPAGAWWCVDWAVAPRQMVVHWVQRHCFHSPCRHPRLLKMPNPLPDPWWHVSEFPVGCVGSENIFINKYTILSLWTTNTKHLGGQRLFTTWCDILSATTYVVWGDWDWNLRLQGQPAVVWAGGKACFHGTATGYGPGGLLPGDGPPGHLGPWAWCWDRRGRLTPKVGGLIFWHLNWSLCWHLEKANHETSWSSNWFANVHTTACVSVGYCNKELVVRLFSYSMMTVLMKHYV